MPIQLPQQQRQGNFGKVGSLVGAAAGAYMSGGSPQGALQGAQMGGSAGGMIDGMAGGPKGPPPQLSSAMDRRMQRDTPQPAAQIQQAESALAALPPEQQKAYGATFRRARMMEEGIA